MQACPDSLAYRAEKFVRRHRGAVGAAALTGVVLIAATVVSTWQMLEARRQHGEAVAAAARAQAWSRFLTLMVGEIGSDDGVKTPTQIIDRGLYLLDQQAGETRSRVDQLVQISGYYARLDASVKELAVLERAETLARRIGYVEGTAKALCEKVDPQIALERRDPARAGLDEARRILAATSRPDPSVAANCESAATAIADADGQSAVAIDHAERALALLRAAARLDDPLYPGIATRLSKYHDDLGHPREAHRYTQLAVEAYDRAGAGGTIYRLIVLNNEAADFVNFGQLRDALDVSDKVVQRLAARGASPAVGIGFAANHAAILSALGRNAEAVPALERTIVDAAAIGDGFWQHRAEYFQARALLHGGRHDEARRALDDVEAAYRHDEAANRNYLDAATVTRAEWLLRTGDVDAADATIDGLLRSLRYPDEKSSWILDGALPVATEIALARHDAAAATAHAGAAVARARAAALDPMRSATLGRALVLLGRAQRAAGLAGAAAETIRAALPSLAGGLGPDHDEVRAAERLMVQDGGNGAAR